MRVFLILGLASAIIAIAVFSSMGRSKLCLRTAYEESSFGAIGLMPLPAEAETEWKQMLDAARKDSLAAGPLLKEIRAQFVKDGVEVNKTAPGLYCGRCRKGPVLAFQINEGGYGYFTIVNLTGPMEIELDKKENGVAITRGAPAPDSGPHELGK